MNEARWNLSQSPRLDGATAIVTGGNVGLGFKSSLELARLGAHVIVACRSEERGRASIARIEADCPGASVETLPLDLASLPSIHAFADRFLESHPRLDLLMNNAGVVNLPTLERTSDGHELHMATNHFGHFALTGRLWTSLLAAERARVVVLSSAAHRFGEIRFDDLDWRKRAYDRGKAYGDSKLANLLFVLALQRRFEGAGSSAIAVAAHPGLTGTERQQSVGIGGRFSRWVASSVEHGVRSQLVAAMAPHVRGGVFFWAQVWHPRAPSAPHGADGTIGPSPGGASLESERKDHEDRLSGRGRAQRLGHVTNRPTLRVSVRAPTRVPLSTAASQAIRRS